MKNIVWVLAALVASVSGAAETATRAQEPARPAPATGPPAKLAVEERRVGDYGDPQCVQVRGATTFTAAAIREALFADMTVLLAAHPAASENQYLDVLRDRVLAGYAHAGFHKAQASVHTDRDHVVLSIQEGPRCTCGEVRISGAKRIPSARLIARLTEPRLPADAANDPDESGTAGASKLDPPVWERGKPAPFDQLSRSGFDAQIQAALADLGYHFPKFEAEVVPQGKEKIAALLVRILDEGPPDVVADIEVVGNERDTLQQILDYLQVRPGMRFDRSQRTRIERLLWNSGRYAAYKVMPVVAEAGQKLNLRLELTEYPAAPPLSADLSRAEKTLLRARQWFTDPNHRRFDWLLWREGEGLRMEMVFSPEYGWLVLVRQAGRPNGPLLWAIALTEQQAGYYNLAEERKIVVPCRSQRVIINIELAFNDDKDQKEKPFAVKFGAGVKSREEHDPPGAVDFRFRAPPAFFVALAHEHEATTRWEGRRLVLTTPIERIEIDEPTGRVLQWAMLNDKGKPSGDFSFVERAMEQRRREIEEASAKWNNSFDPDRPVGSVAKALWKDSCVWTLLRSNVIQNGVHNSQIEKQVREAGRLILDHGVLDPLDDWIVSDRKNPESKAHEFTVPGVNADLPLDNVQKLWAMLPQVCLVAADAVFPRNSWPWTISRELALNWAGHPEYFDHELRRLAAAHDKGPLGCLVTAQVLRTRGLEGYREVAAEGLKHLGAADFRRDYRAILPADRWPAKAVQRIAEMLREWDARDVELLSRLLLKERAPLVENFARQLRAQRGKPIAAALDAMLDEYWDTTLRAEAEALLREAAE